MLNEDTYDELLRTSWFCLRLNWKLSRFGSLYNFFPSLNLSNYNEELFKTIENVTVIKSERGEYHTHTIQNIQ